MHTSKDIKIKEQILKTETKPLANLIFKKNFLKANKNNCPMYHKYRKNVLLIKSTNSEWIFWYRKNKGKIIIVYSGFFFKFPSNYCIRHWLGISTLSILDRTWFRTGNVCLKNDGVTHTYKHTHLFGRSREAKAREDNWQHSGSG